MFRKSVGALCQRNQYTTTLHVINSAIVKLGKLTRAGTVYRGISGGVLPDEFWEENEDGVCGGCECETSLVGFHSDNSHAC
eukprot:5801881-Prymnesium_polylepis.1